MSTAPRALDPPAAEAPKKRRRRNTSHLKIVPETRELREQLREHCRQVARKLDRSHPLTKDEMEAVCREMLGQANMPEGYLGWAMVMLATVFWEDQVAAIPPSRRLFLLPHCLKHAEGCPADYDEFGLDCKQCGACSIADFRTMAEEMGYKVLVAEGSPIVLKIIVGGYVDAVLGVACLNVLEKAIDKILLAGIPCMAVPLLSSDCRNTSVDEDWVSSMIQIQKSAAGPQAKTYLHLMRAASGMFKPEELARLAPRSRTAEFDAENPLADPIAATEALGHEFLAQGGKHSRPFITLAVHDALTGGQATQPGGEEYLQSLSDAVKRTALSIETFHKASLVHDDIEDDDQFRYGEPTLHKKHGISTAINVGDYLIGLGYRLVSREAAALGPDVAVDLLDCLAEAHTRLTEGQGAELIWRDARDKSLTPLDALKIYALKTSPAFEAALFCGARLAGPADQYAKPFRAFARNLGVAFQILNDLGDWRGDSHNKLKAAGDVLGGRPTVLLALALQNLSQTEQTELLDLAGNETQSNEYRISRTRQLYEQAGVFELAQQLIDKHQERAEEIADALENENLRRLFYYLIDTVLERPAETEPETSEELLQVVPLNLK